MGGLELSNTLTFRKLKNRRLSEEIAMEIRRAIIAGRLKPGDFLPSEASMAEQFGASRATVREALRILELTGFIETRKGRGTRVLAMSLSGKFSGLRCCAPDESTLVRDLMRFRSIVEPYCVRHASEHASDELVREMELVLEEIRQETEQGGTGEAQALQFHRLLVDSVGNTVLSYVMQAIDELQRFSRKLTYSVPGRPEQAYREHLEIFQAVKKRDPDTAEALYVKHLAKVSQLFQMCSEGLGQQQK